MKNGENLVLPVFLFVFQRQHLVGQTVRKFGHPIEVYIGVLELLQPVVGCLCLGQVRDSLVQQG